jgi:hypothetical protein
MSDEREALSAAVDSILAPKALRVLHKAIIRDQDGDGNVGVVMAGSGAPSPTAKPVPLWLGLPGFSARMRTSANPEVAIGFHEGSESGAFAALFPTYPQGVSEEAAPLPCIEISFGGGTLPIARRSDRVDTGEIIIRNLPPAPGPIPTGIILTRKPQADAAEEVLGQILGPISVAPDPLIIVLSGRITTGRAEFLA